MTIWSITTASTSDLKQKNRCHINFQIEINQATILEIQRQQSFLTGEHQSKAE